MNNAFFNGDLVKDVYMCHPLGFECTNASFVCKLKNVLCGLKQTPGALF